MEDFRPRNQETNDQYNQEPGIVRIPGSPYMREMSKWEQPYRFQPFPRMVYKAEKYNGKVCCMAAAPNPLEFRDHREAERAEEQAARFTEKCQAIAKDEQELQRLFEAGYREGPEEAVAFALGRDSDVARSTAERLYQDRNMSERARQEADDVTAEAGGDHQPEITPRKVREAREGKRRRSA